MEKGRKRKSRKKFSDNRINIDHETVDLMSGKGEISSDREEYALLKGKERK